MAERHHIFWWHPALRCRKPMPNAMIQTHNVVFLNSAQHHRSLYIGHVHPPQDSVRLKVSVALIHRHRHGIRRCVEIFDNWIRRRNKSSRIRWRRAAARATGRNLPLYFLLKRDRFHQVILNGVGTFAGFNRTESLYFFGVRLSKILVCTENRDLRFLDENPSAKAATPPNDKTIVTTIPMPILS